MLPPSRASARIADKASTATATRTTACPDCFATRLPASVLRAHGAGNSHDDPGREKLRAERRQRLEVVFDGDGQRVVAGITGGDRVANASDGRGLSRPRIRRRCEGARWRTNLDEPGVGRDTLAP